MSVSAVTSASPTSPTTYLPPLPSPLRWVAWLAAGWRTRRAAWACQVSFPFFVFFSLLFFNPEDKIDDDSFFIVLIFEFGAHLTGPSVTGLCALHDVKYWVILRSSYDAVTSFFPFFFFGAQGWMGGGSSLPTLSNNARPPP